jgi:hypothetical protein
MGVLTDVFIASETGLTPDLLERGPLGLVPAVEGKGFDWNAIEELATALGIDPPLNSNKSFLEPVGGNGSGGQCICRISDDVVRTLAAADEQEQARVRGKWMGHEEPDGLGIKSDAQIWFEKFAALMRQAIAEGKGAFVWLCP